MARVRDIHIGDRYLFKFDNYETTGEVLRWKTEGVSVWFLPDEGFTAHKGWTLWGNNLNAFATDICHLRVIEETLPEIDCAAIKDLL